MGVGDVLELVVGKPRVCRYVGFDDAVWFVFEAREKKAAVAEEAPVLQ
jgi:hypothetical protein